MSVLVQKWSKGAGDYGGAIWGGAKWARGASYTYPPLFLTYKKRLWIMLARRGNDWIDLHGLRKREQNRNPTGCAGDCAFCIHPLWGSGTGMRVTSALFRAATECIVSHGYSLKVKMGNPRNPFAVHTNVAQGCPASHMILGEAGKIFHNSNCRMWIYADPLQARFASIFDSTISANQHSKLNQKFSHWRRKFKSLKTKIQVTSDKNSSQAGVK